MSNQVEVHEAGCEFWAGYPCRGQGCYTIDVDDDDSQPSLGSVDEVITLVKSKGDAPIIMRVMWEMKGKTYSWEPMTRENALRLQEWVEGLQEIMNHPAMQVIDEVLYEHRQQHGH